MVNLGFGAHGQVGKRRHPPLAEWVSRPWKGLGRRAHPPQSARNQNHTKKCFYLFFLLIVLGSWCAGCQTLRELLGFGIQKPRVTVLAMAVKSVSYKELNLLVQLKADNPNSIDLEFESLGYQVAIDQTPVASGQYTSPIRLLAESHLKIDLPLKISTQNALAIVEALVTRPNPDTKLHFAAQVVFKSPVGPLHLDFKESRPLLNP